MNIRHAETDDAERIKQVALKSWKNTYKDLLPQETIEEIVNEWYNLDELREQVKDPVFLVAENSNISGFIHCSSDSRKAHLHRLYLIPEKQGQGIGKKLLEKAEEELKNRAEEIELEVLSENDKAVEFYRKTGYEELKEEKVELKGETVQQKLMIKKLS